MADTKHVFISVCEESADLHAASLVRAARERLPQCAWHGLTGPRLRALGVETVYDFAAHAAMLSGILGVIGRARQALRAIEASWNRRRPDLVVLLDSPELHLRLATKARRLGIPVLYYIAPQTWAARAYRNRRIVRDIDRLACILPFEEAYFRAAAERRPGTAFRATYVGHPLFEALRQAAPAPGTLEMLRDRAAGRKIVALLPGSRRHVIRTMLPLQLEVLRRLRAAGRDVYAAISCVSADRRELIRDLLAAALPAFPPPAQPTATAPPDDGLADVGVDIVVDDNASLLTAADLVLVASGTAALHVAHYRKPMVVMYDAGRLLYWPHRLLGRFVIRAPHLSLVNILAQARVVPEFMPFIRDVAPLAAVAGQLLTDETWRQIMVRQIDEVVRPLEASDASVRVCELAAELLGLQRPA